MVSFGKTGRCAPDQSHTVSVVYSALGCLIVIRNMEPRLIDPFNRTIEYVRLSVTDRCDLRCMYCLPADYRDFSEPEHWLTFDEIEDLVQFCANSPGKSSGSCR